MEDGFLRKPGASGSSHPRGRQHSVGSPKMGLVDWLTVSRPLLTPPKMWPVGPLNGLGVAPAYRPPGWWRTTGSVPRLPPSPHIPQAPTARGGASRARGSQHLAAPCPATLCSAVSWVLDGAHVRPCWTGQARPAPPPGSKRQGQAGSPQEAGVGICPEAQGHTLVSHDTVSPAPRGPQSPRQTPAPEEAALTRAQALCPPGREVTGLHPRHHPGGGATPRGLLNRLHSPKAEARPAGLAGAQDA